MQELNPAYSCFNGIAFSVAYSLERETSLTHRNSINSVILLSLSEEPTSSRADSTRREQQTSFCITD